MEIKIFMVKCDTNMLVSQKHRKSDNICLYGMLLLS